MPQFNHFDLTLLQPAFGSRLVEVVMELEYLRRLRLSGSTPAPVFFQLKDIFHVLESLGSARIEGNHTTLADYVESRVDGHAHDSDQLREITNIERAMAYVEDSLETGAAISEQFIRELHAIVVENLQREGDKTPGAYRSDNVSITGAEHKPPEFVQVQGYMQDLVLFINTEHGKQFDLLKIAQAHHRFVWIHPFGNGNGRVVRLLTYALLIKFGFNVNTGGRVLNPTAVFCNDRDRYNAMLAKADTGENGLLEEWCLYVLEGILTELRKVDQLTDFNYLRTKIIFPALALSLERHLITPIEHGILRATMSSESGVVKAADLATAMPTMSDAQRTYQIKKLVDRKMLLPIKEGARQYTIGFSNSYLMRGVVKTLADEAFIPATLNR